MICMFKAIHYCQLIYEDFRNMCLEIYELDPAKFLSASGLAQPVALKDKSKIRPFN